MNSTFTLLAFLGTRSLSGGVFVTELTLTPSRRARRGEHDGAGPVGNGRRDAKFREADDTNDKKHKTMNKET